MCVEFIDLLYNLTWTDVSTAFILFNLIFFIDLERVFVIALVNVLINIFNGLDGGTDLYVYISVETSCKSRIIRNSPTVIKYVARALFNFHTVHDAATAIRWIFIILNSGSIVKGR